MFLTTGIFGNFKGWRGKFLTFKTGIPGGPARKMKGKCAMCAFQVTGPNKPNARLSFLQQTSKFNVR